MWRQRGGDGGRHLSAELHIPLVTAMTHLHLVPMSPELCPLWPRPRPATQGGRGCQGRWTNTFAFPCWRRRAQGEALHPSSTTYAIGSGAEPVGREALRPSSTTSATGSARRTSREGGPSPLFHHSSRTLSSSTAGTGGRCRAPHRRPRPPPAPPDESY
jgi:hypothetical protein